jgi:hypothetical protein
VSDSAKALEWNRGCRGARARVHERGQDLSSELLSLAIIAAILLIPLLILERSRQYERTLSLIARGPADHAGDVGAVSKALDDPRKRQRLAADLARALERAENWESLPVAARPPGEVRKLASFRGDIEQIISLAKISDAAPAGLALLELSLLGGYGSAVSSSDPQTLRELLWRIRYLLAPTAPRPSVLAKSPR